MTQVVPPLSSPVGVIAGGGILPFAVADSLQRRGIAPVIFALKGFCDPQAVTAYKHHWIAVGKFGTNTTLFASENCRDLVFIGGLVRPALSEVRLDWGTLRVIPEIVAAFRGGDNHLLTGIAGIIEKRGFRLRGVAEVAPDLLMPEGAITRTTPADEQMRADIAKGLEVLRAMSPFDTGQAAVVLDGHVVAVEDIEGTDALLARVARLRSNGRIRAKAGRGVLVKAPKTTQDLRFDLPALGAKTIDGVAAAQLAGIAIVAGQTILAEPQALVEAADRAGVFVMGLPA